MTVTAGISSGGGAPTGPAGGDLAGTYPNPTVAQATGLFSALAGESIADGQNVALGTTTGTKIGTATTQKLGFYNATPVVQQTGASDVLASLVNLGLRAASANPPLNLGTGAITAGIATFSGAVSVTTGPLSTSAGVSTSFGGTVTLTEGTSIVVGTVTGSIIGTGAAQKLAFYGAAPVVQAGTFAAVATTASTQTSPFGYTTAAQADSIPTIINSIRTALRNIGIVA